MKNNIFSTICSAAAGIFLSSITIWLALVTIRKGNEAILITSLFSFIASLVIMRADIKKKIVNFIITASASKLMTMVYNKKFLFQQRINRITQPNEPLGTAGLPDSRISGAFMLNMFIIFAVFVISHFVLRKLYWKKYTDEVLPEGFVRTAHAAQYTAAFIMLIVSVILLSQVNNTELIRGLLYSYRW